MLIKIGLRQATRQIKANVFHVLSLAIIFMVTFVLATYAFDKELTENLTSTISSGFLNNIGGLGSIFRVFLFLTIAINLFFIAYIFRLRLRQNAKMYALYRLFGLKNKDLLTLYFFEVIIFTVIAAILGGVFGIVMIRVSKVILLTLASFVETKVEFTFSLRSYFISVGIYFVEMIVAMLFSFFIIVKSDIILLFKREQLIQKISKGTPLYIGFSALLFFILPHFAKIGDKPEDFFLNFGISFLVSISAMFLMYKSGITSFFSVRRFLGLNKRHGSEFITGRFFFSELNKSAMMMTIVSIFLIGIFLFTFISQMFISPEMLIKTTSSDFSMLDARQDDVQKVEKYLQDRHIEYYASDFEYIHIITNKDTKKHVPAASVVDEIQKIKMSAVTTDETIKDEHTFVISNQTYNNQIQQLKKANRNTYEAIEKIYHMQGSAQIKQIAGTVRNDVAFIPNTTVDLAQSIPQEDFSQAKAIRFFDYPSFGGRGSLATLALSSTTFIVNDTKYKELSNYGLVRKIRVFNTPRLTVNEFKQLNTDTPLHNYEVVSTVGRMGRQTINAEIQSPIMFCFSILFFQVLFYIVVLILYRLSEMIQKQFKAFQTLHIVGASDATIIGSIVMQTAITIFFPVIVSFYVSWIAVSGVFKQFYKAEEILTNITKYLPHVTISFLIITILFICYQSLTIRRQFKA